MPHQQVLLWDDDFGRWGPMCDLRAAFDLRTGAQTNRQRIEQALDKPIDLLWTAKPHLIALLRSEHALPVNDLSSFRQPDETVLCINGRWMGMTGCEAVRNLQPNHAIVHKGRQIIAACLPQKDVQSFLADDVLPAQVQRVIRDDHVLMDRPWHILDHLETTLPDDLQHTHVPVFSTEAQHKAAAQRVICFGDHPVHIAEDVRIQPGVVLNSEQGAIVIESGALIGALSILEGPCYIGSKSQVAGHSHIRPYTSIGPVCKVAGEISHTIMHSFANKGHHGYLGHALLGQWVNLGAATNVSNLKNTYGPVRVELEHGYPAEDTHRQFHGPIFGDFVRTGVGTRLLTGTVLGTGSMVAMPGFPPRHVQRFSFITDRGKAMYEIDRFIATVQRMMQRRDCRLKPAVEQRLRHIAAAQAGQFNAA